MSCSSRSVRGVACLSVFVCIWLFVVFVCLSYCLFVVRMCLFLSVFPFFCMVVCLSVNVVVLFDVCLPRCLSVWLFFFQSARLFAYLSVCLVVFCLFVYLSVCLSV